MKKETTQFRWMLTMLMLVVAMPTLAGLQSYDSNGFGSDGSYQPATLTTGKYDIIDLLTKGKTRTLNGFTSKQGKPFSAAIAFDENFNTNSSLQSAKQQKSEEM